VPGRDLRLESLRALPGLLGDDRGERVENGIESIEPVEDRVDHLHGRELLGLHVPGDRDRVHPADLVRRP
jgi:hypothetical protein